MIYRNIPKIKSYTPGEGCVCVCLCVCVAGGVGEWNTPNSEDPPWETHNKCMYTQTQCTGLCTQAHRRGVAHVGTERTALW